MSGMCLVGSGDDMRGRGRGRGRGRRARGGRYGGDRYSGKAVSQMHERIIRSERDRRSRSDI